MTVIAFSRPGYLAIRSNRQAPAAPKVPISAHAERSQTTKTLEKSHRAVTTSRMPKPALTANFQLPEAVTEITERRKIAEAMVDELLPALLTAYGKNGRKGWQENYNRRFNEILNHHLFSKGPKTHVQVHVNFDAIPPYQRGTDFKSQLGLKPPKLSLLQRLTPWKQPQSLLHLGESTLASGEPPNTPEAKERLHGLMKRQVHNLLFEMNREYRKMHPTEFTSAIPYAPDRI